MPDFIGREQELRTLHDLLDEVRRSRSGRLLAVRGRRRAGKSRLIEEWLLRERVPSVFFEAARKDGARELADFADQLGGSALGAAARDLTPRSWDAALAIVARRTDPAEPAVVVLDEFPYLLESDPNVDAAIQRVWDREIDHRVPLIVVLIGSDLGMMERLAQYDRPLYGRVREMVVAPLSPADTAEMVGGSPASALDAYLVLGGYPALVETWRPSETLWSFLRRGLEPTSPLVVNGERMLTSEFPSDLSARAVLEAVGSGETTYSGIADTAGVPRTTLNRALEVLIARKRVVVAAEPLSSLPSARLRRYAVADPHLRFWLRFIGSSLPEIERGRRDLVLERIRSEWTAYAGRAIEPVVREAVTRMLPDPARFGDARYCGAFWTRTNDFEVDLVGADRETVAQSIAFIGSIKWRERHPFDGRDAAALRAQLPRVPGAGTGTRLVAVARAGCTTDAVDVAIGPEDLIAAFRPAG